MDWRLKCAAFYALSYLPFRRALHAKAQRFLGTHFLTLTDRELAAYSFHIENFTARAPGGVALEFGSGTNLLVPLLLSAAGASRIYTLDQERMATVDQVNHVIAQLRARGGEWPAIENLGESLARLYRIEYVAPGDARATGLADGSVDFICTTSVLEHITPRDLDKILAECLRIGSPRMTMSHNIGYIDHYAHADPAISYFNFYKFPDWLWALFNPPMQYQNRLRHPDFERLFARAGMCEIVNRRLMALPKHRLPTVPIAGKFAHYGEADLYAHDGLFVLGKGQADSAGGS